jgi:hypothetical protein
MVREMVRSRSRSGRDLRDPAKEEEQTALTAGLVSLGPAVVEDLLAKVQEAGWDSPAGREARWAAEALQTMGRGAVAGLAREIEKCCRKEPVAAVAFFVVYGGIEENKDAARTAAFCTLAFAQLLFSFGCRSARYTLRQLGAFSNPWLFGGIAVSVLAQLAVVTVPFLTPLFKVALLPFGWEWLMVAALAVAPVAVIEAVKLVREHLRRRAADGGS